MRDYQVRGLNWMISLYENGINGILADEMVNRIILVFFCYSIIFNYSYWNIVSVLFVESYAVFWDAVLCVMWLHKTCEHLNSQYKDLLFVCQLLSRVLARHCRLSRCWAT